MQALKIKDITLNEVIKDAKRIYPDLNIETALDYYSKIQMSVGLYSKDKIKQIDSYFKWNLAMLIIDALQPDYDWQAMGKILNN